jgi:hypothetical protein
MRDHCTRCLHAAACCSQAHRQSPSRLHELHGLLARPTSAPPRPHPSVRARDPANTMRSLRSAHRATAGRSPSPPSRWDASKRAPHAASRPARRAACPALAATRRRRHHLVGSHGSHTRASSLSLSRNPTPLSGLFSHCVLQVRRVRVGVAPAVPSAWARRRRGVRRHMRRLTNSVPALVILSQHCIHRSSVPALTSAAIEHEYVAALCVCALSVLCRRDLGRSTWHTRPW